MSIKQIDRYQILAVIGRGGMATVYHGRGPSGRDLAIKVLRPEYLNDLGFRARFQREAQTIAALDHPAIVPLLAYGRHEEQLFLVMPYMPGGSLALRLRQRVLSPQTTGTVLARIASALDDAHTRGIVHRDLKPSNILFDGDGQAYLADFGIALQTAAGGISHEVIDGTPAYMSPEQCRPEANIDGRSDVYSLGVTLFEMLTGRLPFSGDSPLAILAQHVHHPPPALRSLNPDLPATLEPVLNKALAKEPATRYQTAAALSAAYQRALATPAVEGEAVGAPSEGSDAPQVEEGAVESSAAIYPRPAADANHRRLLQTRVSRLANDARHWAARNIILALALVSLPGMLCAVAAVRAIRGPAMFQTWTSRVNWLSSPTEVAFLPLIRTDGTGEQAAARTPNATPPAPNLLLLYTPESMTVVNTSNENLSLAGLSFRRPGTAGSGAAQFAADEWRGVAGRAVTALPPGECLQLLRLNGPAPNPQEPPSCNRLRGWLGTRREQRLFFLPTAEADAFEVLSGEQRVGRCVIADGQCQMYVPQP